MIKYSQSTNYIVQQAHRYNCYINGWSPARIKIQYGTYSWDYLALCIDDYIKLENKTELNIEKVAESIHKSWARNYIYWRDNKPYNTNRIYIKPKKQLDDEKRNQCAQLSYEQFFSAMPALVQAPSALSFL